MSKEEMPLKKKHDKLKHTSVKSMRSKMSGRGK